MTTQAVTASTRIRLHPLRMRPDGEQWCVGRVETGDFVVLSPIAMDALRLLDTDLPVGEVAQRLRDTQGRDIDMVDFVDNLLDLGYVAAVDGQPVSHATLPMKPTWSWLHEHHTRWALSSWVAMMTVVLPVLAACAAISVPGLLPNYQDLLWSRHGSLVLLGNAVIGWSIVFFHELGHLITARGAGVPARVTLATRLQFLAVQTDVSGVWAAPRKVRVTVYLAGIAIQFGIASAAILARLAIGPDTATGRVLGATALLSLLLVSPQLLLFMRTDLYFVLQDLTGCRNLYADGSAYVRYRAHHALYWISRKDPTPVDPSIALARRERRTVQVYALILVVGTALCLLFAASVTLPTALTLLTRAARPLVGGEGAGLLDSGLTILIIGGFWALWCRTWWRHHGPKIVTWWTRRRV
ncbi:hypothetical protein [Rhizomonospora bruguierae]|uniref:hypothetical protein n=1 Tax=Rhizomonospora bruguierae TaxID=1581705 RepID=UPI001BCB77B6|nr:hypothetical protein [Micromonospora sp. NBRC 107566]